MATLDNIALDRAEYVDLLRKIMAHNEKLQNNPANVEKLVRISRSQTRHNMAYHIVASSHDAPPSLDSATNPAAEEVGRGAAPPLTHRSAARSLQVPQEDLVVDVIMTFLAPVTYVCNLPTLGSRAMITHCWTLVAAEGQAPRRKGLPRWLQKGGSQYASGS